MNTSRICFFGSYKKYQFYCVQCALCMLYCRIRYHRLHSTSFLKAHIFFWFFLIAEVSQMPCRYPKSFMVVALISLRLFLKCMTKIITFDIAKRSYTFSFMECRSFHNILQLLGLYHWKKFVSKCMGQAEHGFDL